MLFSCKHVVSNDDKHHLEVYLRDMKQELYWEYATAIVFFPR